MNTTLIFLVKRYHLLYSLYDSDSNSNFFKIKNKQIAHIVQILEETLNVLEKLNPVHALLISEFYKKKKTLRETTNVAREKFPEYDDYSVIWYKKQKTYALDKFCFLLKQHAEIDEIIKFTNELKETLEKENVKL